MSTAPTSPAFGRHVVTAVLVAHNGARWLPQSAAGLRAQTRAPQRFVAVDTASTDGSAEILAQLLGPDRVVAAPARTPVSAPRSISASPPPTRGTARTTPWPAASTATPSTPTSPCSGSGCCTTTPSRSCDALEHLLRLVDSSPTVAVAGPKLRGWTNRRALLEVGVTISRSGRRETGLERREQDQGQHDGVARRARGVDRRHARTT